MFLLLFQVQVIKKRLQDIRLAIQRWYLTGFGFGQVAFYRIIISFALEHQAARWSVCFIFLFLLAPIQEGAPILQRHPNSQSGAR